MSWSPLKGAGRCPRLRPLARARALARCSGSAHDCLFFWRVKRVRALIQMLNPRTKKSTQTTYLFSTILPWPDNKSNRVFVTAYLRLASFFPRLLVAHPAIGAFICFRVRLIIFIYLFIFALVFLVLYIYILILTFLFHSIFVSRFISFILGIINFSI